MDMKNKNAALGLGVIVTSIAILAILGYFWGAQFAHWGYGQLRGNLIYILPIIVGLITIAYGFIKDRQSVLIIGCILTLVVPVIPMPFTNYARAQAYVDVITTEQSNGEDISYKPRTPFEVASSVSDRNLGETMGRSIQQVTALPAVSENTTYTTAVIRRGIFEGYESVQVMDLPLYGSTSSQDVKFCKFNEDAKLRFGGEIPSNDLGRALAWKTQLSVRWNKRDAFFYCNDDVPEIYIPLKKIAGNPFIGHEVPYGVAIYNGHTGDLSIETEYAGDLPVYPLSLAKKQRASTTASGSLWDYWMRRAGYATTEKDQDEMDNAEENESTEDGEIVRNENLADYSLAGDTTGNSYFVTPLTPRGSSSSIIAIGNIQSNTIKNGELNPYSVYRYDIPRQAKSTIASRIISEELSGYRAQGLHVFEVTPERNGNWVATIGQRQTVIYRATISPEGKISLQTVDGSQKNNVNNSEEMETKAEKNITDMSNEELRQLADDILNELASRAGQE